MEFKIGDLVIVSSPEIEYVQYKDRMGDVIDFDGVVYKCRFSNYRNDWDYFYPEELQLAKNHIVINILKDL